MISRPKKIEGDDVSGHSTALQEQISHMGEISAGQITVPAIEENSSSNQTNKRIAMIVLVFFVLYVLMNGLPSLNGFTGSGPQYKPVNRFEGEKDSDEEDEDPSERRRMLEMSSFGTGPAYRE